MLTNNFSHNMVKDDGGAMTLLDNTIAYVHSSVFAGNKAHSHGEVNGIQQSSTLESVNSTFQNSNDHTHAGKGSGIMCIAFWFYAARSGYGQSDCCCLHHSHLNH